MYKVYDNYDLDMEELGEATTLTAANRIAAGRDVDTDGECYIIIKKLNKQTNKWEEK